jgi:hypothetical protein
MTAAFPIISEPPGQSVTVRPTAAAVAETEQLQVTVVELAELVVAEPAIALLQPVVTESLTQAAAVVVEDSLVLPTVAAVAL